MEDSEHAIVTIDRKDSTSMYKVSIDIVDQLHGILSKLITLLLISMGLAQSSFSVRKSKFLWNLTID